MIGIALIGYGYWGPKLGRAFAATAGAQLVAICDRASERLRAAALEHPGAILSTDFRDLLRDPRVDALAIATPAASHALIAAAALESGRHVFVEKPMTTDCASAVHLVRLAARRRLVLMVDHTYRFTPEVRRMIELVRRGSLGVLAAYDSVRIDHGRVQRDVDVIWDLAGHDFSMLDAMADRPTAISVSRAIQAGDCRAQAAHVDVHYANDFTAHLEVSWLAPSKVRRIKVDGDGGYVIYDGAHPACRLTGRANGRSLCTPAKTGDALSCAADHFAGCVNSGAEPETDGAAGLRVVEWLTAASRSLSTGLPAEL